MRSAALLILSVALVFAVYKLIVTLVKIKREITRKNNR